MTIRLLRIPDHQFIFQDIQMKSQSLIVLFTLLLLQVTESSPISGILDNDNRSTDPRANSLDPDVDYEQALLSTLENAGFNRGIGNDELFFDEIAAFLEGTDQDVCLSTGLLESSEKRDTKFEKEISRESSLAQNHRVNHCPNSKVSDQDYAEPSRLNGHFEDDDSKVQSRRRKHSEAFCNDTQSRTKSGRFKKRTHAGQSRPEPNETSIKE